MNEDPTGMEENEENDEGGTMNGRRKPQQDLKKYNMHNKLVGMIMVLAFAGMITTMRGGSLDAPAAPTSSNSAMWTLEKIYNVLDTRTTNVTVRSVAFVEPGGLPTNGTMHTLNDIMTLVTNRAPVSKTGQKIAYATNDDGWCGTNVGVAWSVSRFTTNAVATNVVTDNLTGLMWIKNANMFGQTDWYTAIDSCEVLDSGGYSDWRLPNIRELHSLIDASTDSVPGGAPFKNVQDFYWSSTTDAGVNTNYAFFVKFGVGDMGSQSKTVVYYVWPVRSGGN